MTSISNNYDIKREGSLNKINKIHTYVFIEYMPHKKSKIIFTGKILDEFTDPKEPRINIVRYSRILKQSPLEKSCLHYIRHISKYRDIMVKILQNECKRYLNRSGTVSIPKSWLHIQGRLICGLFPELCKRMPADVILYIEEFI